MHNTDDVEHFVDLLAALPWRVQSDGRGVQLDDTATDLDNAIFGAGGDRHPMLLNGQLDFHPLLRGKRDHALIFRAAMYAFVVFDGAPESVTEEAGRVVRNTLSVRESDPGRVGRRWMEDLTATTYRLLLRDTGRDRRAQFDSQSAR